MKQYVYALNLHTNTEQRFTIEQWKDILNNGLKDRYKFIDAKYEPEPEQPKTAAPSKPKKKCGC